jgi:hypothetical protein
MSVRQETTTVAVALPAGLADRWDALAADPVSTAGFIEACRKTMSAEFSSGVVYLHHGDRLVAGAALFEHVLRVDMAMPPGLRALGDLLLRIAPQFVRVPILCLGSPMADRCGLVVDPSLSPLDRRRAMLALVDRLMEHGETTGAHLVAIKDLPGAIGSDLHAALADRGFARTPGLPMACLDLKFACSDEYIASLEPKHRADIRRKLRQGRGVTLSEVECTPELEVEIERLFVGARAHRKADFGPFDAIPPGLVGALLQSMGKGASLVASRVGDRVVGINVVLQHGGTGTGYKIALDQDEVRRNNLFFLNWIWSIDHLIARGATRLDAGQTTYAVKQRLGCRLEPSWIYFRHRSPAWNRVCHVLGRRYPFALMDPDLKAAGYSP